MRNFFNFLLSLIGFIYSERVSLYFKRIYTFIYGQIRTSWFKKVGNVVSIEGPCVIKGAKYIEVGNNVVIKKGLRIEAIDSYKGSKFYPRIIVGNNVCINNDCHIGAIGKLSIGDNVVLASKVFISDHFHGESRSEDMNITVENRDLFIKGNVEIGNNVWIGEGVAILSGVVIGDNCVIGANSVITKSFPSNCIIGGVPGKLLRKV